jgi:hypothetical protein
LLYSLLLLPCARLGEGKNYCVNSLSEIIQIQIHSSSTRAVALVVALIELLQTVSRSLLASFFFLFCHLESRVESRGEEAESTMAQLSKSFSLSFFMQIHPSRNFHVYIFSLRSCSFLSLLSLLEESRSSPSTRHFQAERSEMKPPKTLVYFNSMNKKRQ